MDEQWKTLVREYQISNLGRIRDRRTKLVYLPDATSLAHADPAVMLDGARIRIRESVERAFDAETAELAALIALGRDRIAQFEQQTKARLKLLQEAGRILEEAPRLAREGMREISAGEDISPLVNDEKIACEEARRLGTIWRLDLPVDPVSMLKRDEIFQRLKSLQAIYGDPIQAAARVPLGSP